MSETPTATTLQTLRAMRELLADEGRWCKGEGAVNALGVDVPLLSDAACRWCILGAAGKVTGEEFRDESGVSGWYWALLETLLGEQLEGGALFLADWNDAPERTHADVVNLLDRTISRLEAAP